MRMNIIERTINDVTVLDLEGNLALNENARFRKHVTGAIDAGARKLIVNLARVKYMDSLLAITKLDSVFETFDSEPAAVSSFTPCTE